MRMQRLARVVVVGGGVLGMTHAAEARERGYQVVHLEREPGSRGATRAELRPDLGQRPGERARAGAGLARQTALGAAGRAGAWHGIPRRTVRSPWPPTMPRPRCSARPPACLTRRSGATGCSTRRRCASVNPALRGEFTCGLLGGQDAIVEPRQVPAAIRDYLLASGTAGAYTWLPGTGGGRDRAGSRPRPHRSVAPRRPGRAVHRGRPTPGSPARTCPAMPGRRCAGSGCRCCRPSRSAAC